MHFGQNNTFISSTDPSLQNYLVKPANKNSQRRKGELSQVPAFNNNLNKIENSINALNQMDLLETITLLLKQYDFIIQLLIQNFMLTNNQNLKYRCYNMIFSFYMARLRIIDNYKIPEFDIKFNFNQVNNKAGRGYRIQGYRRVSKPPHFIIKLFILL